MDSNPRTQRAEQSSYDGKEIDYEEVTRKLIVGPPAIDQMRKEINSVVHGIIRIILSEQDGLTRLFPQKRTGRFEFFPPNPEFSEVFFSPKCEWRISADRTNGLWLIRGADCWLKKNIGSFKAYSAYSHAIHSNQFHFQDVQGVHECLSVFVKGMAKAFPFLTESWQPFMDAADHFERR